jgi:hypothetical protein
LGKGLKTLCYYVRTKAISTGAKHLAVDISKVGSTKKLTKPKVDQLNKNQRILNLNVLGVVLNIK